jgi:hypothetical protein
MDISVHNLVLLKVLPNVCVLVVTGTLYLLMLSTRWKWSRLSWVAFCLAIGLTLTTGMILRDMRVSLNKNLINQKEVPLDSPIEHRKCFHSRNLEGLLYRVRGTGIGEGVVRYGSTGSYRKCPRDPGVEQWPVNLKLQYGT